MRKHKIILLGFIAAFAVSLIAGVATLGSSVNASGAPAWGSVTVEESYEYGSTFSLPSGGSRRWCRRKPISWQTAPCCPSGS